MRHHAIPADVAIVAMRLLGTLVKAKRHDKVDGSFSMPSM
jgi:hypothetical protein